MSPVPCCGRSGGVVLRLVPRRRLRVPGEPRTPGRRGLCARHTRRFVREGIPSTIAFVYRHLVRSARERVEEAERVLRAGRLPPYSVLAPQGTCPACAQERAAENRLRGELARVLNGPAPGIPLPPDPCLPHRRGLLEASGCPVCRRGEHARAQYLTRLSREILSAPSYAWGQTTPLCPRHGWTFARTGDPRAIHLLADRMREFWGEGREKTGDKPSLPPTTAHHGLQTLCAALRLPPPPPPAAGLPRRRRACCGSPPCPACQAEATAAERPHLLLLATLADPSVRSSYDRSTGLCPTHLSHALSLARRAEEPTVLVKGARVRLEVLAWELEEYLRKRSWTVRYEEEGPEGTAWVRAVHTLSQVSPPR